MSSCELEFDRLQAPVENGAMLAEPPMDQVGEVVGENLYLREQWDCDVHGRPLAELSALARTELLEAARRWTSQYRDVAIQRDAARGTIFVAGHQPQMFHPGVWLKNFALGSLAGAHGATAVNLVIDNDVLAEAAIPVPTGSVESPRLERIAFDRPGAKVPFEERRIEDRELFASFGRRAAEHVGRLVPNPLIQRYWPRVQTRSRYTDNLGACLAQARHQLEGDWGLQTLEVPQSHVCDGEAFQWFIAHLLARLPEFHETYNGAIHEYRAAHHIRSVSHPAPDLVEDGPWLESPLWVWTAKEPRRRRLFARAAGGEVVLTDRESWETRLPLNAEGGAVRAVARLLDLQRDGVRIRSRALITTLWARLALGDLFLHGIGGAKYDQVTNTLIERFFRIRPPCFMVVSATLYLPIDRPRGTAADANGVAQELRNLTYHPEMFFDPSDDASHELMKAKQRWIATPRTIENARQRCHAIREINAAAQSRLAAQRQRLLELQTANERRRKAENILGSRDYAFCLYPDGDLRRFLSPLTDGMP